MLTDTELDNMDEVITEIGRAKSCFIPSVLEDVKKALLEKGYKGAEEYVEHLTGESYTELTRVLIICEEHKLGPEAAAKVIENLNRIESGKWSDVAKANADDGSKFGPDVSKIKADIDKSVAEEEAPYVNECQFKGHEPEENATDAKAKILLTRSDVSGKCE